MAEMKWVDGRDVAEYRAGDFRGETMEVVRPSDVERCSVITLCKVTAYTQSEFNAAIAKAKSDVWNAAIRIVKDLIPELEELNKIESANGFIGTSYELGQTKDIIEMLEAAKKAEE